MMRHTDFDNQVQLDQPVDQSILEDLRTRVATVLPSIAEVELETVWVAVRPIPADGLTVAGFAGRSDNLYVIVSHSAVTLGPLLGSLRRPRKYRKDGEIQARLLSAQIV